MTQTIVLTATEFDVAWESERLPPRHVAIDVPSPGRTYTERGQIAKQVWESLEKRGLARGERVTGELADVLHAVANYALAIDTWVWNDRQISALTTLTGNYAQLTVLDNGEVWFIPARDTSLIESAVSVLGSLDAGNGYSVSLPNETLRDADRAAGGDPARLVTALRERGLSLGDAQTLAHMFNGMSQRGQLGVQTRDPRGGVDRANRVVSFHDTDDGRYLYLCRPTSDGSVWATVTPIDNVRLVGCVRELLEEVGVNSPEPPTSGLRLA